MQPIKNGNPYASPATPPGGPQGTPMQDTTIAKSFKFDEKGTTKNATFSGPVIAFDDGFLLVPKKMQSQSGTAIAVNFGLLGMLIASLFNNIKKVDFPYPTITYAMLEEIFPGVGGLGRLKPDQPIVLLKRDQVLGYTSSFWTGVQLVCSGENVFLMGSKNKITAALAEFGYQEHTAQS